MNGKPWDLDTQKLTVTNSNFLKIIKHFRVQSLPNSQVSPVNGFRQLHEHVFVSSVPPLLHRFPRHGAVIKSQFTF